MKITLSSLYNYFNQGIINLFRIWELQLFHFSVLFISVSYRFDLFNIKRLFFESFNKNEIVNLIISIVIFIEMFIFSCLLLLGIRRLLNSIKNAVFNLFIPEKISNNFSELKDKYIRLKKINFLLVVISLFLIALILI